MNALVSRFEIPEFDHFGYDAAIRTATMRAAHSFFDCHVIEDDDGSFRVVEEGDYNALPVHLFDRIVHTVQGQMADDFDEENIARAASFMSVLMDADWDDDCPF